MKYVKIFVFTGLILLLNCNKLENNFFSSPQKKLSASWRLVGVYKDGSIVKKDTCGLGFPSDGYDLFFYGNGEVEQFFCPILLFNSNRYVYGTWELKDKNKEIRIILTDTAAGYNILPITPSEVKWKILELTTKKLHVQETRMDGIYEFSFSSDKPD